MAAILDVKLTNIKRKNMLVFVWGYPHVKFGEDKYTIQGDTECDRSMDKHIYTG